MPSFMVPEEVIAVKRVGSIARNGAELDSKNARIAMNEGLIVVADTADDNDCDLPGATGEIKTALGATVYRAMKEEGASTHYDADEQVTIIRKGTIYLTCKSACAIGGDVFVVHSGADAGQVRLDANAEATLLAGARFAETLSGAGVALVTLNLPS